MVTGACETGKNRGLRLSFAKTSSRRQMPHIGREPLVGELEFIEKISLAYRKLTVDHGIRRELSARRRTWAVPARRKLTIFRKTNL